jgi:hypothetical protein
MKTIDKFDDIAQEAIAKAEKVNVSFDVFVDGLHDMICALRDRHQMAQSELADRESEESSDDE